MISWPRSNMILTNRRKATQRKEWDWNQWEDDVNDENVEDDENIENDKTVENDETMETG